MLQNGIGLPVFLSVTFPLIEYCFEELIKLGISPFLLVSELAKMMLPINRSRKQVINLVHFMTYCMKFLKIQSEKQTKVRKHKKRMYPLS
jgi:UTP-glucose-1-phosphate uridylyltransferase